MRRYVVERLEDRCRPTLSAWGPGEVVEALLHSNPGRVGMRVVAVEAPSGDASYDDYDHAWNEANPKPDLDFAALVKRHFPDANSAVDVGCGWGATSQALMGEGYAWVIGMDVSRQTVEKNKGSTVAVLFDGWTLPLPNESADVVICKDTLTHIVNETQFEELVRSMCDVARLGVVVSNNIEANPGRLHRGVSGWIHALSQFAHVQAVTEGHPPGVASFVMGKLRG